MKLPQDRFEWKEQLHRTRVSQKKTFEPSNPTPRSTRFLEDSVRVPVKDLPFYLRHSRKVQAVLITSGVLIFFSKPLYDIFIAPRKPLPLEELLLHPKSRDGISIQSTRAYGQIPETPRRV